MTGPPCFRRLAACPRALLRRVLAVLGLAGVVARWKASARQHGLSWLLTASKPLLLLMARSMGRKVKRSLWCGTPIINMAVSARAERLLGVQTDSLVYFTYFVTDEFTINLSKWFKGSEWWTRIVLPYLVFVWACVRYQRFHYFCDRGLLPVDRFTFNEEEMKWLKLLGKEVFFYTYGADVRTKKITQSLGRHNCCTECPNPGVCCVCDDDEGAWLQSRLRRYGNAVFSMGDMIHYTPGSRNDLFFWPIDLAAEGGRRYQPVYPDPDSTRPLRVVHAPNHRGFKGTHFLIETVEKLQAEGLPIELVLVERVPNREALEIYRTADVIFDQCLVGFHGYFALEALAIGKPVMVFIRHPRLYLADADECPFVNTPQDRIEPNLRMLAANRPLLHELGRRGRRYIEKHHDLLPFAKRLAQAIQETTRTPKHVAAANEPLRRAA